MSFTPRGIITPIITPFTREGRINEPVLRQIIDFLVGGGIHGILPLGTTGEFYGVDEDDYRRILEITVEQTNGRVPVYAGANHITTRGTIKLIKIAEKTGVDAITVLTPMFISQTQEELYMFFKTVAESTGLPVVMYNNKPKTNVTIEPETVARLAAIENIVGIKDSTGDFTNTAEYIWLTRHGSLQRADQQGYANPRSPVLRASGAIASCARSAAAHGSYIRQVCGGDIMGVLRPNSAGPLRLAFNLGSPRGYQELAMQGFDVGKA